MVKVKEYSKLTLEQIDEKIKKNEEILNKIWDEDDGSSYDAYRKKCQPYWDDNDTLYMVKSMKEEPIMEHMSDLDKRCRMDIDRFKEDCECGGFVDSDGIGYYATEDMVSNIEAIPSAFAAGHIRPDFKYVCWYNK